MIQKLKLIKDNLPEVVLALKRRGIKIVSYNDVNELILPEPLSPDNLVEYLRLLNHYYFRKVMSEYFETLKGKSAGRLITNPLYSRYLERMKKLGINNYKNCQKSFGVTLEWFIAYSLEKEYGISSIWKTKLNIVRGGDFDVIAFLEGKIIYIECKSSPPQNISIEEIKRFIKRLSALKPSAALLYIDTTLKIERNIVNNIIELLKPIKSLLKLKEGVYRINSNTYISSSERNLISNLGTVIKDIIYIA